MATGVTTAVGFNTQAYYLKLIYENVKLLNESVGTEETDPIFTASEAAGITATDITTWNTAVQPGDNISELNNDSGFITGTTGFSGSFVTATDTITVVDGLITAVTPL